MTHILATCRWPDGDSKEVVVRGQTGHDQFDIIWNDKIDSIEDGKVERNVRVSGFQETVPTKWLSNFRKVVT